ncbi:hypothetical protein BACCIP111895_00535 [Neobacillus rhizosphaerae]|uniref:Cadherin-like beta-sandwich-like domain-containing protein n=1 Tax=Neobacillus rhizosphaerae TaxID=2880965 RepID=A0ABM9ELD4_9BACI|nr:cadherin-like beta sandwich domain-containing protein [Neobacillus rhizosphaerae]CAH2713400.1 hypothetical protein BACCIP111895_00535 [Neobacillus rhizosphaerae]
MKSKVQKKGMNVILTVSMLGMVSGSYIPTAYAESNTTAVQENLESNTLANLEIDEIKLDQTFTSEVKEYSATVGNDVPDIQLQVESSNPESSILINGQSVTSGTTGTYSLQTGKNTFLITVSDGSNTANTYILTITRKQNANNLLQNIKLSTGELSPIFSSTKTEYTVQVTNDADAIKITPTRIEKTATIKINNTLAKGEGVSVELPVGKSDIIIVVTAENGEEKTYTLHVIRAEGKDSKANISSQKNRTNSFQQTAVQQNSGTVQKTSKATLSSLTVSEGTWDSSFTPNEFTYHVAVSSDVKTVTINPTASYSASTIMIEGGTSKTIQLEDNNKTIISVVVTYDDGDHKTYVLVFDKKE